MENLVPGSDLGTLIQEFLMSMGPEIFQYLAEKLNDTDIVLDFVNGIFNGTQTLGDFPFAY